MPARSRSRECSAAEVSRRVKMLDTNMANFFTVENLEECNISVGIRFHRCFHLLDKRKFEQRFWNLIMTKCEVERNQVSRLSCLDSRHYHALQSSWVESLPCLLN